MVFCGISALPLTAAPLASGYLLFLDIISEFTGRSLKVSLCSQSPWEISEGPISSTVILASNVSFCPLSIIPPLPQTEHLEGWDCTLLFVTVAKV